MLASLAGIAMAPQTKVANKTFLGTYANITPVTKDTWFYLDEDDGDILEFADANGRQIRVDYDSNGKPMLFYLATPEKGKISSVKKVYNDYESMVYMTKQLVFWANNEYHSDDVKNEDFTNDVLGYIRSFNTKYTTNKWSFVANPLNNRFISAVDNIVKEGLTFKDYYGTFAEDYNSSLHGAMSSNMKTKMVDCLDSTKTIDLIHMYASMDFIYTQYVSYYTGHACNYMEDLATWGGDLQQEMDRQYGKFGNFSTSTYITDFSSILSTPGSKFPMDDLLADIDAYNMMNEPTLQHTSLIIKLDHYYNYYLCQLHARFGIFLTAQSEHTWGKKSYTLEDKTLELLHLKKENGNYSDSGKIDLIEYKIVPNISQIPVSVRAAVANSFIAYINTEAYR